MSNETPSPPVICFVGPKNSGKTTLLEKVVLRLKAGGLRVAAVKHDAHDFEIDHPGKDSYRLAAAGADSVVIASGTRAALVVRPPRELSLAQLIDRFIRDVDVVLVEGYKSSGYPKIEVHRKATGMPLLPLSPGERMAVASDEPLELAVPRFGLDDADGVAALVREAVAGTRGKGT